MQTSPMCRQIAYAAHGNPRIDMQRLTEVQVSQQQCHTKLLMNPWRSDKDLLSSKPCRQPHDSADRNRNSTETEREREKECSAPATQKGSASSVYYTCHARLCACVRLAARQKLSLCTAPATQKGSAEALQAKGSRGPAAATAPQLLQKALCTAPATQKGRAEALCTAPARQKAAAGQRHSL